MILFVAALAECCHFHGLALSLRQSGREGGWLLEHTLRCVARHRHGRGRRLPLLRAPQLLP